MEITTVQVSEKLRKRLARLKQHPRETYEEVIERALDERPVPKVDGLSGAASAALADFLPRVRTLYGPRLRRLLLYGSYARGEAGFDSDVDVLVVLDGPVDVGEELSRIVDLTYPIQLARGIHLSALPMAERDFLTRASPLLLNVRREGIPL